MAVDRGGLRYTISVEDRFSAQIKRLRDQLRALEGDLRRVSATRAQFASSQSSSAQAVQSAGAAQASAARSTVASQQRVQRQLAHTERQLARTRSQFQRMRSSARSADSAVNRVSFSFRRLIGILAIFQGARAGVNLFTGAISGGIRFNQTIENSRIQMAALFTTAGRVVDAQGKQLEGQEAFNRALVIADDQIQKLRVDSLGTVGTFEELQRAFAASVGPGLEAGLNVDQIRTFSVRISQAAAAMGLAQNQLIEESRSFLRGTIQARTTLVASILGVSNEAVRDAKAAGKQVEFFKNVLDGFRFSADATQQSLSGLTARFRDAVQGAAGTASIGLFNELKTTVKELSEQFFEFERDATGAIIGISANKNAVAVLAQVFKGLENGLVNLRQGLTKISLQNLLVAFRGLGDILQGTLAFLTGFLRGGLEGFSILVALANEFTGAIGGLQNDKLEAVGRSVALIASLLVGAASAAALLTGLLKLAKSPALRLSVAIGAITAGLKLVAEEILGVTVTFKEVGEILRLTFVQAFGTIQRQGTIIFKTFANDLVGIFGDPLGVIADKFSTLFGAISGAGAALASLGVISEEARVAVEDSVGALADLAAKRAAGSEGFFYTKKSLEDDKINLQDFIDKSDKTLQDLAASIAARAANRDVPFVQPEDLDTAGFASKVESLATNIASVMNGIVGEQIFDTAGIVKKLKETFDKVVSAANAKGKEVIGPFFGKLVKQISSGLTIVRLIAKQTSEEISNLIIDAFDPNKKVNLEERFRKLFRNIVNGIIKELVRLAIAKTILSLTGNGAAGGGQITGKANGGQVLGFDGGGTVPGGVHSVPQFRPASVAKSDTVPAWLTPKEFVHPVKAVNRYGADLMELMRRGAVDPGALRAVAGLNNKRAAAVVSSAAHRGRGYAAGGSVIGAGDRSDLAASSSGRGSSVVVATVPGNNRTMERLMHTGRESVLDFMSENAGAIDGILSRNRTPS